MKHKYLSLVALAGAMFMSTSAWAQWEEPTKPELEKKNVDAVESGKTYYIMNVGAGQFITGSNDWSTKISLTRDGVTSEYAPALAIYVADSAQVFSGSKCSGVSMRLDGTFTVNGASGKRTFTNTYLFRDSEEFGFMDHGSQAKGYIWNITKVESGYYRIQTAEGDPSYPDAASQYAGWDSSNGPIAVDEYGELILDEESGLEPNTMVYFNMTEDDENIDWMFIDAAAYLVKLAAYSAREALYELLISTTELGFDVNTDAATAVYNNPDATKAELETAANNLKAEINRAQFADLFSGASDDDPLDVTEDVLENPRFDTGDISGWVCTFVSGQTATNIGYQSNSTYTNGEASLNQFIEAWQQSTDTKKTIGDGELYQTVFGLPQGKYMLEADVNAVDQYQGNNPVTGAYIFIQSANAETKTAVATGNGQPEHFSVVFLHDGSDMLTFGLKTESTTANWIAADNFKLTYYGAYEGTPEQAMLQNAIKSAEAANEEIEYGEVFAYQGDINAFKEALANAQAVVVTEATAEQYTAAKDALEAAITQYQASVKAYEKLATFIGADGGASKLDEYMDIAGQLGDIYDTVEPWESELKDGYYDGSITVERMNELMEGFLPVLRAAIKDGHITPGADITILLDNADFSEGSGATNIPGWTIKSGNITELSAKYHNIEAYHYEFDFCQTITDMPAGVYNIGVQGFVRVDGWTDHGDYRGDENNMVLYGGLSNKRFKKLTDEYSETALLGDNGDDSSGSWPYDTPHTDITEDGSKVYVPNSMEGAKAYFDAINPMTDKPFYFNEVQIIHGGGDLTIGVKCEKANNLWILWDNFTIQYVGQDIDQYIQMVQDEFDLLQQAYEAEGSFVTKKAADEFDALAVKVANAGNIASGEEALALIDEIDQLIAYINEGTKLSSSLKGVYDLYNLSDGQLIVGVQSSDPAFPELMDQVENAISDPTLLADNEAIAPLAASVKKAWSIYVLYDAEEEPSQKYEASAIIYNPDYTNYQLQQGYSAEGWTIENIGGAQAADWDEYECYNNDTINVYQKIEGLKPGFYEIAVQGYYRAGFPTDYNDSLATVNHAYLSATSSLGETTTRMKNIVEGGEEYQMSVGAESLITLSETSVYVPNNMEAAQTYFFNESYPNSLIAQVGEDGELTIAVKKFSHIEGDWTIFTNWQLFYLGKTGKNFQEELSAVESLEALQSLKAAQFFGIDGRQQSRLQRGINIVRMADGSVQKVLVK